MSDNGLFLKEIEFKDNFWSFKAGTKVYFNDGMREILKFYFKKKW